jgi:hypothetical protein
MSVPKVHCWYYHNDLLVPHDIASGKPDGPVRYLHTGCSGNGRYVSKDSGEP